MGQVPLQSRGYLPRLAPEFYQGRAVVFWTYTIEDRGKGWLTTDFHAAFRELMLHCAARENLLCPIYTLMPDHLHFIWMGMSADSDQRRASTFLRTHLTPSLKPHKLQHQAHEHVLREEERKRKAFATTCSYIAENPVRAGLVAARNEWKYIGCVVPGYPSLNYSDPDFWDRFWKIYNDPADRRSP